MSSISRRILLYWLLLLVPALAVGGGAMLLLWREQGRLAERSAETAAARQATAAARARLIVENVELLVGDVQSGLLDALAAEPAGGLEVFLEAWEQNNPLVRIAFRATADGRLLRPEARTANEDARGFLRRYGQQFGGRAPWALEGAKPEAGAKLAADAKLDGAEAEARKEVSANIAQVQSARRGVQELFKSRDASGQGLAGQTLADAAAPAAASPVGASAVAGPGARAEEAEADRYRGAAMSESTTVAGTDRARIQKRVDPSVPLAAAAPSLVRAKDALAERRDWTAWTVDGRLHLLGWVQSEPTGDVRGVEIETAALISRLAGALPVEVSAGEGFALRDAQGRVMHQVGTVLETAAPAARVPLALATLPGWDVVAFVTSLQGQRTGGPAMLWTSLALVGLFVAAIAIGGSLLMAQARRSEEEAAQKTSFVANVSHEFKTPLTTIRLYSELLEQGRVRDAAQGNDYLRTIGRETQRLARLVNNALDFSRLEQGRKKYACEEVDLKSELTRLLDTHALRFAESGLALHRELGVDAAVVATDRDALEQIVLNLLDNAAKYAAEGGEVMVALAARPGGGAEVRVTDRGPGVPAEHRERIFEKFHRVDEALTAEKGGAGLGLSIARQLARGLGGDLRYESRAGGGAEFVLTLSSTFRMHSE